MTLTTNGMHKNRRIHTSCLFSGVWVASIVAPGGSVDHIPGEFPSHGQALQAAKESIDQKDQEPNLRE
jgi:hypothetical protein